PPRRELRRLSPQHPGRLARRQPQGHRPRCDGGLAGHRDARSRRTTAGGAPMKLTSVIRRPLVTEKTSNARANAGILVFEVALGATKVEVKKAIQTLFGSKVASV